MKKIISLLLVLMIVLSFAACAGKKAPKQDGFTFGAVMMSLNAPIWIELMEYGDQCAAEYNSTVIWKSAEGSLENQIALVEGFIEQGVDCIMIDPFDAVSVLPVIKEALDAASWNLMTE